MIRKVVYLLIPTSNHNQLSAARLVLVLYIFWFLHQTTTDFDAEKQKVGCISFDSYIKPQRVAQANLLTVVVYLLIPTSNHNIKSIQSRNRIVVYLLIPTSNHNTANTQLGVEGLYIFWFLHQTTTTTLFLYSVSVLYIFWFLHQTTTTTLFLYSVSVLYIFWFLHQTTTACCYFSSSARCISFDSYIKPQLIQFFVEVDIVVYLLIPTSNHNWCKPRCAESSVVYLLIPTSNHNLSYDGWWLCWLYIFWFLHQTTTPLTPVSVAKRCISFDSYIKPQLSWTVCIYIFVVYLLIPTSNHNLSKCLYFTELLYIFWFLHQTTTYRFEHTDFQRITNTLSNKKWWVGYNF